MIHDIFVRRYPQKLIWRDDISEEVHTFFFQSAHIVFSDLASKLELDEDFFARAHDFLARELGTGRLLDQDSMSSICGHYLTQPYNLWNDHHRSPDYFFKTRISLLEIILREAQEVALSLNQKSQSKGLFSLKSRRVQLNSNETMDSFKQAVAELNQRLRLANIDLHFHNGLFQFSHDTLAEQVIQEPCWQLLQAPEWENVDIELKEALDRATLGASDAPFYAAKALESTIKIICETSNLSTGRERGAANYIENLSKGSSNQIISEWEKDMLLAYFRHVRNPYGHGAGTQKPVKFEDYQVDWAIETAMSWIKSLVRRTNHR